MPMWASSRPDVAAGGFTLLEVLVVLVILSMAVAVIGPRLQKTYDAVVASGEREEVLRQLQRLPAVATAEDGLVAAAGSGALQKRLEMPAGWTVVPIDEIRVESSGACRAARVRIRAPEQFGNAPVDVKLLAPHCEVRVAL